MHDILEESFLYSYLEATAHIKAEPQYYCYYDIGECHTKSNLLGDSMLFNYTMVPELDTSDKVELENWLGAIISIYCKTFSIRQREDFIREIS